MRVLYSLGAPTRLGPAAVTISFFDGVHLGHRQLLERAAEVAQRHGATRVALTWWPFSFPDAEAEGAEVRPEGSGGVLTTLDEKLEALAATGLLDATLVLAWAPELAAQSADVLSTMLRAWCEPVALLAGADATRGEDRMSSALLAGGKQQGLAVESLAMGEDGEVVSGERIWHVVRAGDVQATARLLGRPYALTGEVVPGDRRGRLLGFPTANLRMDERKVLPANGVYAVRVRLPGEARALHAGVANIGVRPTFSGERKLLVEVHLLDTAMDLYGLTLRVELIARLREERRFDGVDALKAQIGRDAQAARELLAAGTRKAGTDAAAEDRSEAPWA